MREKHSKAQMKSENKSKCKDIVKVSYEVQLSMISAKNIRHNLLDINAEQSKLYAQIKDLRL